jgi:hypothetical protein
MPKRIPNVHVLAPEVLELLTAHKYTQRNKRNTITIYGRFTAV